MIWCNFIQESLLWCFFYDILVYSKHGEEHNKHLQVFLSLLKEHQLFACKKKIYFWATTIETFRPYDFCSRSSSTSIEAWHVNELTHTKDVKYVRYLLSLNGYYKMFVKDYGKISRSLTQLLNKKFLFEWWNKDISGYF